MKVKNLLIILLIILNSCGEKTKKVYYDNGELFYEKHSLPDNNDSIFYTKEYYRNGNLKQEGLLRDDSIMEGHWKLYFSDGVLRWEGEYRNSKIIHEKYSKNWKWVNMDQYFKGTEIEGNPKRLIVGKTYNFRIDMPTVHPKLYIVVDVNFRNIKKTENYEMFPYSFTPTKSGKYFFRIVFMNKAGYFIVGNPMLTLGFDIENQ